MTVAYTGLLRIETGKAEETFDLPPGATVGGALTRVTEALGRSEEEALAGYFVIIALPGERARALGPDGRNETLVDGARLTLLYRFAGG